MYVVKPSRSFLLLPPHPKLSMSIFFSLRGKVGTFKRKKKISWHFFSLRERRTSCTSRILLKRKTVPFFFFSAPPFPRKTSPPHQKKRVYCEEASLPFPPIVVPRRRRLWSFSILLLLLLLLLPRQGQKTISIGFSACPQKCHYNNLGWNSETPLQFIPFVGTCWQLALQCGSSNRRFRIYNLFFKRIEKML